MAHGISSVISEHPGCGKLGPLIGCV